ncbi:uncharacterized protein LOC130749940 [Actinidia eriantha]|uniref:uncharacterized protein LOC130749940 n=1 Tax=Actinidia eriantha TaxID=165200 RepID=UPI00258ACEFA|nr:uncharacterized protein LOC130749940 [Actinidia eriantha]
MKGIMRFGKKGKLNPWYVGPFEILEKIGTVAYRLVLTLDFANVHDVFHVSVLRKYITDLTQVLDQPPIELKGNLQYEEQPVRIMDSRMKQLRNKAIPLVKVWWENQTTVEVTWEKESDMRQKYPYLFEQSEACRRAVTVDDGYFKQVIDLMIMGIDSALIPNLMPKGTQ